MTISLGARAGTCENIFLILEDKTADNFFSTCIVTYNKWSKIQLLRRNISRPFFYHTLQAVPLPDLSRKMKGPLLAKYPISILAYIWGCNAFSMPLWVWNWMRGLYFAEQSCFFSDSLIFTIKYQLSEKICSSHRLVSQPIAHYLMRYQR